MGPDRLFVLQKSAVVLVFDDLVPVGFEDLQVTQPEPQPLHLASKLPQSGIGGHDVRVYCRAPMLFGSDGEVLYNS